MIAKCLQAYLVSLCFASQMLLLFFSQHNLMARASTSKKVMTHFPAAVWNQTPNLSQVCLYLIFPEWLRHLLSKACTYSFPQTFERKFLCRECTREKPHSIWRLGLSTPKGANKSTTVNNVSPAWLSSGISDKNPQSAISLWKTFQRGCPSKDPCSLHLPGYQCMSCTYIQNKG